MEGTQVNWSKTPWGSEAKFIRASVVGMDVSACFEGVPVRSQILEQEECDVIAERIAANCLEATGHFKATANDNNEDGTSTV